MRSQVRKRDRRDRLLHSQDMSPAEKEHVPTVVYMGLLDEVATSFVGGQSLERLGFNKEQRVVNREWAEKSEYPKNDRQTTAHG